MIKTVGPTLAAAALLACAGTASASAATTVQPASHTAHAANSGYLNTFKVHVGDLPDGTRLVASTVSSNTAGGLASGPVSGSELPAEMTDVYKVVWSLDHDTTISVTYDLLRENSDGSATETGKTIDLVLDVDGNDHATLGVAHQNGLVATRPTTAPLEVDLVVC